MNPDELEDLYPCIGVCMLDPDSGNCEGCGRPLLDSSDIVIETEQTVGSPADYPGDSNITK